MTRQRAYTEDARTYDQSTQAYQTFRHEIVAGLPLRPGDVVVDVGCGTGLCFPLLQDRIGPTGRIIGVDASPEMVALARARVATEGWDNVTLVESAVEEVYLPAEADAALFCAVHDVMRSPAALRNVLAWLRPGGHVAAGGGKWAAPWLVPLNLQIMALHRPYVTSFEGFDRPWSFLVDLVEEFALSELAFGSGYVATGRVPWGAPRPRHLPARGRWG
jgi:ubiquinone/menaquinone biosynthesis C-methylase UbiE